MKTNILVVVTLSFASIAGLADAKKLFLNCSTSDKARVEVRVPTKGVAEITEILDGVSGKPRTATLEGATGMTYVELQIKSANNTILSVGAEGSTTLSGFYINDANKKVGITCNL